MAYINPFANKKNFRRINLYPKKYMIEFGGFVQDMNHPIFLKDYKSGEIVKYSGIYTCKNCSYEIGISEGKEFPSQDKRFPPCPNKDCNHTHYALLVLANHVSYSIEPQ